MKNYFIKSQRIKFSHWTEEDYPLAKRLWENEKVSEYITATGKFTQEEIKARLKKEMENQNKYGIEYWPIFFSGNDEFIGCCGLRPYFMENKILEIGFHLLPEFWGRGLAKEAAKTVIDYARDILEVHGIFAGHNPNNINSAKLLLKLGFIYTHDEFYEPTGLDHPSYILQIK